MSGLSRVTYKQVPTAILKKVASSPSNICELSSIWIPGSAGVVEVRSFPNFSSQTLISLAMLLPGSNAKPSSTHRILLLRNEISDPIPSKLEKLIENRCCNFALKSSQNFPQIGCRPHESKWHIVGCEQGMVVHCRTQTGELLPEMPSDTSTKHELQVSDLEDSSAPPMFDSPI